MTVLTIPDAIALGEILSVAQRSAKVAWLNSHGDIAYGTARHIVTSPDNYGFLGSGHDVRDGYLRITSSNGFDHALSVSELIAMVHRGEFQEYDW